MREAPKALGLSARALARALEVDGKTVHRWKAEGAPVYVAYVLLGLAGSRGLLRTDGRWLARLLDVVRELPQD